MSRRSQAFAHGAGEPNPLRWHVAIVNPGYEAHVSAAMQDRGIDTLLPMIRYWRIRNRRRLVVERPLLPRCVIFGMDHDTQHVSGITGLERVVRGASQGWANIPAREVYDLRFAMLRGEFDATLRQWSRERPLPDLIKRLIAEGELMPEAGWTHREAKRAGLKFSEAA